MSNILKSEVFKQPPNIPGDDDVILKVIDAFATKVGE
jgi:hypothetical protein